MNVIDSLVVVLDLDPSKFTQHQQEAMEALRQTEEQMVRGGKEIESQGKKTDEYFSGLKRQALGVLSLFLGGKGVKEFVGHVTTLDAATNRAARTLNMTANELSAWGYVAERTGGSVQSITSAIQGLSGAMHHFDLTGQGDIAGIMDHLKLSIYDANKQIKTGGQMILEIADAAKKLNPENFARLAATLALIPGMNQETINAMAGGRAPLEKLLAEGRNITNVTRESADAAERLASAWAKTLQTSTAFGRVLLTNITPALETVLALSNYILDKISGKVRPAPSKETDPEALGYFGPSTEEKAPDRKPTFGENVRKRFRSIYYQEKFEKEDQEAAVYGGKPSSGQPAPPSRRLASPTDSAGAPTSAAPPAARAPAVATPSAPAPAPQPPALSFSPAPPQPRRFRGADGTELVVITTKGGKNVTVAAEAAESFKSFLDDLEGKGAPIGSLGGYNNRTIFGTNVPSEHSRGKAIDMGSMTGRDKIDPALRSWIEENDAAWRDALTRHNMRSGGDFKRPDLGHVEWRGPTTSPEWYGWKGEQPGSPGSTPAAGAPAAATINNNRTSGNTSSSTSTTTIGRIEINTQATDAEGIARDIRPAMERTSFAAAANYAQV